MMNGSSLHLYLGSPGTSHSRLLPVPLGSGGPLWLAAVGCTLDADPCHSLGLWVLQMPAEKGREAWSHPWFCWARSLGKEFQ